MTASCIPECVRPGYIVICQNTDVWESLARFQKDVGIAAQTMLLAATEMGLGGCMIGNFHAGEVKGALSLADNLAPLLIVAVGKPAEKVVLTEIEKGEPTRITAMRMTFTTFRRESFQIFF